MEFNLLYYGFILIAILITLGAQVFVNSTYNKFKVVKNKKNLTGREAARIILDSKGLQDIKINEVNGYLTDHYDLSKKVINLSSHNYEEGSLASVAVAIHEVGHALQDKDDYLFLRIRSFLVPVVNFISSSGYVAIIIGLILGAFSLIRISILVELSILIFQLVTLPVEIDASKRALKEIKKANLLLDDEVGQARMVLIAAALTYVASVLTTLLELFRLLLILGRGNNDEL